MGTKRDVYKRADHWTLKAQTEGYPARSVYKLQELDLRFALTRKAHCVLDLGASPGSWSAWLLRHLEGSAKVVAVDLNPLDASVAARGAGEDLVFIQGDITTNEVRDEVARHGLFDLVVSDAAPLTSGNHLVDSSRSRELVHAALGYAQAVLKVGGSFCAKVFQSGGEQRLLDEMKAIFDGVKVSKPKACRPTSREIYLVGLGKL